MEPLEEVVVRRLTASRKTLAVAESCSGGLIAHRITNVPGASEIFLGGLVAYSNAAKMTVLGVREEHLLREGAVSEATARAMAEGARRLFQSDYAVSATGIAGPGGGTTDKPVGLVYIAVARADETRAARCSFSGDREYIKRQTADKALNMLVEWLA
ncbi:MAG TPA: CinA family protein [Candidatus Hydrogenedentes bacterium]|nr:CinA family protein [Candidatus Hydrogenedentota bacterium]